jgi:nitrate reductase cytochrome c-type subunit
VKGEATPIPASHYVDLRNAPGVRGAEVAGARWVCTACHVPQQDVQPLVGSPFPR